MRLLTFSLLEFMYDGCHACETFAPQWEWIVTRYQAAHLPRVHFGTVDCRQEPSLCGGLPSVPRLRLYADGVLVSSFGPLDYAPADIFDYIATEAQALQAKRPRAKKLCARRRLVLASNK